MYPTRAWRTLRGVDDGVTREEIDAFIEAHRARCLWFVRHDFAPSDDDERRWALGQIQRNCDRAAFARAAILKRWLSPRSSDVSAGS